MRQTDTAGNTSGSSSLSFTLDTTIAAPTIALTTDSGTSNSDLISNTGTLNIGNVEPGATVQYSTDGGTTWTNSFTPVEGTNTVAVRQTDTAGNTSGSSSLSFTLDTTIAAPTIALTTDSGTSNSDLISNTGTLNIGNVEAGATVQYSTDGGTTWTNSFTPVEGSNTVAVRQIDTAGNTSGSSSLSFTLDTTIAAPTIALTTDSGSSNADGITNDGTLNIGNVEPGATVQYSTDGGTTWTNSFTPVEGSNTVAVRQIDTAGNTSGSSSLSFTLDTTVAAPTIALTTDSGTSNSDLITNNGTLNIGNVEPGATVQYSTDGGTTWTNSFTPVEGSNTVAVRQTDTAGNTSGSSSLSFTLDTTVAAPTIALTTDSGTSNSDLITNNGTLNIGNVEPGATVQYSTDGGTTWTNSFTPVEGTNTVAVRQTDTAGNTSGSSSLSFTLDTTVAAPTIALTTDSGTSNSDLISNTGTLNIGNVEAGATVQYSTDGGTTWTNSFTPVEGSNTVAVRQIDTAGNTSGSSSLSFTLDTTIAAPTIALTTDSGSSNADGITNDGTLNIGNVEPGATVQYSTDGGTTWTNSFTPVEGSNTVAVRQTDTAGNTSGSSSLSFTLDTTIAAPTIALTTDSGSSNADGITNNGTLNIGNVEPGATVQYSTDGGTTWTNSFTPVEGSNTVAVRQIDTAGNTSGSSSLSFTLDTTVAAPTIALTTDSGSSNADGITNNGTLNIGNVEPGRTVQYSTDGGTTWTNSFTPVEGTNTVAVRQTDTAGNTSGSSSLSFTLDTTIAAPTIALTTDSGSSNADGITNNGTLNIGNVEPGATVQYSTDGGTTWTNSFTPVEGTNTVAVRQTDTAGNTSGSSSLSFTLDTTIAAPTIALTTDSGTSNSDLISNTGTLNIGNVEPGATVQYSTDGGTTWTNSFTPVEGTNTVAVRQTDTAGNTSGSSSLSFTLDTTIAAPTIALTTDSGTSNSDLISNTGTLNIGNVEAGATVQYSTDGGTTWTNSFTPVEGSNTVAVRQIDTAGNTSGSSSLSFTLDTTIAAPTIALTTDSGSSNADGITNDGTLNIGNVEPGATVQYSTDGGTTWTNSFTPVEGSNTVAVRQIDTAGNTSGSSSLSFTLDTTVAAPTIALTTDSGTSNSDLITNNGTLNIGNVEPGATVQYSTDGGTTWTNSFTPVEGSNTVAVRQTDTAGNTSGSSSLSFTLDTTVAAPTIALTTDSGTSNSDLITNNGTLNIGNVEPGATVQYSTDGGTTWTNSFTPVEGTNTVAVRQTDTAGNTSGSSSLSFTLDTTVAAPTIALTTDSGTSNSDLISNTGTLNIGNVEAGATVQYSTDGGTTWTNSFTPVEGSNTVAVRQIDTAGNTSGSSSLSFTLRYHYCSTDHCLNH